MNIIPSIDLYDQKCVRLQKGDFNALTDYGLDPVEVAVQYADQGINTIHIVDLNGAKHGSFTQLSTVVKITQLTSLLVQVGGGLRREDHIEPLLAAGVKRVVLGTIAVTQPSLVRSLMTRYGVERFVLAFDVNFSKQPRIAIKGWAEKTAWSLWDLLACYQEFSDLTILCTDIDRDGMLAGPNIELYSQCQQKFPDFQFQASGGVSSEEDVLALAHVGVSAVIIGKALYEQEISAKKLVMTHSVS